MPDQILLDPKSGLLLCADLPDRGRRPRLLSVHRGAGNIQVQSGSGALICAGTYPVGIVSDRCMHALTTLPYGCEMLLG